MLARRLGNPNTMAYKRLQQHGLVREQSRFLLLRNGKLKFIDRQPKNVSGLPIVANDYRRDIGFASPGTIQGEFLPHLGDLFRQHLKARERQIIRDIRHYTAISRENRIFRCAIEIRRTIQQYIVVLFERRGQCCVQNLKDGRGLQLVAHFSARWDCYQPPAPHAGKVTRALITSPIIE